MILATGEHTSLMHGWIPVTAQAAAVLSLILAVGWRSRRWLWRLPLIAGLGLAAAGARTGSSPTTACRVSLRR